MFLFYFNVLTKIKWKTNVILKYFQQNIYTTHHNTNFTQSNNPKEPCSFGA
jgi:hypothetical protein